MAFHPRRWLCASLGGLLMVGCTTIPDKIDADVSMKVAARPAAVQATAPAQPAPPRPTVMVTGVQAAADDAPPPASPWQDLRRRLK